MSTDPEPTHTTATGLIHGQCRTCGATCRCAFDLESGDCAALLAERDNLAGELATLRAEVQRNIERLIQFPECYNGCHAFVWHTGNRLRQALAGQATQPAQSHAAGSERGGAGHPVQEADGAQRGPQEAA